ncbi:5914_t:CDS:2, partial [Racocetra persica]
MTEGCQNLRKRPRSVMQESFPSTSKFRTQLEMQKFSYPFGINTLEGIEEIFEKTGIWLMVFSSDICVNDNKTGEFAETYFQSSQCLWYDIIDYALLPIAKKEKIPPKQFKSSKKEVIKLPTGKEQLDKYTIVVLLRLKKKASNEKRRTYVLNFCSKKDPQQSIAILSKYWGKSHGEFLFLHKMNSAKFLPKQLEYNSHLVINRLGEFYLCIPEPLKIRAENQGPLLSENQEK